MTKRLYKYNCLSDFLYSQGAEGAKEFARKLDSVCEDAMDLFVALKVRMDDVESRSGSVVGKIESLSRICGLADALARAVSHKKTIGLAVDLDRVVRMSGEDAE